MTVRMNKKSLLKKIKNATQTRNTWEKITEPVLSSSGPFSPENFVVFPDGFALSYAVDRRKQKDSVLLSITPKSATNHPMNP